MKKSCSKIWRGKEKGCTFATLSPLERGRQDLGKAGEIKIIDKTEKKQV
ncbi:hypothetical protein BARVI_06535 [Barnesiella viscericola DSM 18177]|uniref:Uncharacterized protein n=1 Tax=Barnesiella viscericola DSM 18177 TaxID=880074 RepID=W0ES29_9BACT|nr:hypothetical protein BARVI_02680 [Barnesiella viscericola DSM 18177]AHF13784.1 hypothetical protein BARVI_06535 [Barnesiella viscericola DSM 18177]